MKTFIKVITLYTTIIFAYLTIGSIDSIVEKGILCLISFLVLNFGCIFANKVLLSKEDFLKLSGYNWFNKFTKDL